KSRSEARAFPAPLRPAGDAALAFSPTPSTNACHRSSFSVHAAWLVSFTPPAIRTGRAGSAIKRRDHRTERAERALRRCRVGEGLLGGAASPATLFAASLFS